MPDPTDIAIVGMGAVFPGAGDVATYWRNIHDSVDAITEVPPHRWDPEVYYRPDDPGSDRFYCRRGGFIDDLATFEPTRFGIMPAAVDGTEPDQLLVLRAAAEAITDSGGPDALPDPGRVGVIIGRGGYLTPGVARLDQRVRTAHQLTALLGDLVPGLDQDHLDSVREAFQDALGPDRAEASIGLVPNFAASRVANRFDFRGPAYTVDAACASSLLAIDHAVRELTSGRCDAVLAGGVHTCHHTTLWSVFTQLRALSPTEQIRPFDRRADGTLLSEGTGVVLLKRLADALSAEDRVYAVIRGVGVASDGRATSMMSPLADGQILAVERAWQAAGVDPAAPEALGLLEAHGTATPAGDGVELDTLRRVFGVGGSPIGLGTVKSMIGHTMPAAGIAGLIKAALAIHHETLPPTLHIAEPHPALTGTRFTPLTEPRPWDRPRTQPRRAAVNAFGFGGINAHVILEEPPGTPTPSHSATPSHPDEAHAVLNQHPATATPAHLARTPHPHEAHTVLNQQPATATPGHLARTPHSHEAHTVLNQHPAATPTHLATTPHPHEAHVPETSAGARLNPGHPQAPATTAPPQTATTAAARLTPGPPQAPATVGLSRETAAGPSQAAITASSRESAASTAATVRHTTESATPTASAPGHGADFAARRFEPAAGERMLLLAGHDAEDIAAALRADDADLLARAAKPVGTGPIGDGPCRLAIVAPDARRLALARKIVARGRPWRGRSDVWFAPRPMLSGPEQVAFLFPGFEPEFAPRIEGVAEHFGLPAPELRGDREEVVAHALDVIAVSRLFATALDILGVTPGVLAGHSLGEWTAMIVAGVYPAIDEFMASMRPGMVEVPDVVYAALGASADRVNGVLGEFDGVVVSHDNCPHQSVVCGPVDRVEQVVERLRREGVLAQPLPFRTGFHSPMYAPHLAAARSTLRSLEVLPPTVPIWSATSLAPFPRDPDDVRDLVLRHLVEPVRFRQLTELLHDSGVRAFVQLGPGSLTGFVEDTLHYREHLAVATAVSQRDGLGQLRRVLAALWADGLSPRFEELPDAPHVEPNEPTPRHPEHRAAEHRAAEHRTPAPEHNAPGHGTPEHHTAERPRPAPEHSTRDHHTPASGHNAPGHGTPEHDAPGHHTPTSERNAASPDHGAPEHRTPAPEHGTREQRDARHPDPGQPEPERSEPRRAGAAVRLRLGDPLIRLTAGAAAGLVPSMGATPAFSAVSGGGPVLAEFAALLEGANSSARQVLAAFDAGPREEDPGATDPPETRPADEGTGRRTTTRVFSLETMPDIADHCVFPQPAGWPEASDRFPVVPMTTLLEVMADAARDLVPDTAVTAFEQVRAARWLTVAPPTTAKVHAVADEAGPPGQRVKVQIEGYASGVVLLAHDGYPPAPEPAPTALRNERPAPVEPGELYRDRWMFHGPRFAGVTGIGSVADDGITGTLRSMPSRGALLDSAGQLIGHWMQVSRTVDQTVLPTGIDRVTMYGPQPPLGSELACTAWIREVSETEMRADAELRDEKGRLWCRIEGWTTRRFATDEAIWQVKFRPETATLSRPRPGGWSVVWERWPDSASRELMMRSYLNAAERARYAELNPLAQRQWLLGRIAIKDAVRRWLWDRGAGPIYPAEITVDNDESGRPLVRGPFRAPRVSVAHCAPSGRGRDRACAVAAAGDSPLGIDVELATARDAGTEDVALTNAERELLDREASTDGDRAVWFARFWTAKEAAGKAVGTGLAGRPRAFEVRPAQTGPGDAPVLLVTAPDGSAHRLATDLISDNGTTYVVAWTIPAPTPPEEP